LTDSASNFDNNELFTNNKAEEIFHDSSSNSTRAVRQRKVGKFLTKLFEYILKENHSNVEIPNVNSPEFILNDKFFDMLQPSNLLESYRLDLRKFQIK
jgi:hypothetical protein